MAEQPSPPKPREYKIHPDDIFDLRERLLAPFCNDEKLLYLMYHALRKSERWGELETDWIWEDRDLLGDADAAVWMCLTIHFGEVLGRPVIVDEEE